MRALRSFVALAVAVSAPLSAQQLQSRPAGGAAPAAAPAVGDMAPDFTAAIAGKNGVAAEPFTLSKMRGKVVVLAFYPQDRTSGCTVELTKFTTDYAKLFDNGDGVVVVPISHDGLADHVSWAKDVNMPFSMVADSSATVAALYGTAGPTPKDYFRRSLWVVGKDGKITYMIPKLNVNSEQAYTDLAAAVAAAKK